MMKWIETTGKNEEEAIQKALRAAVRENGPQAREAAAAEAAETESEQ